MRFVIDGHISWHSAQRLLPLLPAFVAALPALPGRGAVVNARPAFVDSDAEGCGAVVNARPAFVDSDAEGHVSLVQVYLESLHASVQDSGPSFETALAQSDGVTLDLGLENSPLELDRPPAELQSEDQHADPALVPGQLSEPPAIGNPDTVDDVTRTMDVAPTALAVAPTELQSGDQQLDPQLVPGQLSEPPKLGNPNTVDSLTRMISETSPEVAGGGAADAAPLATSGAAPGDAPLDAAPAAPVAESPVEVESSADAIVEDYRNAVQLMGGSKLAGSRLVVGSTEGVDADDQRAAEGEHADIPIFVSRRRRSSQRSAGGVPTQKKAAREAQPEIPALDTPRSGGMSHTGKVRLAIMAVVVGVPTIAFAVVVLAMLLVSKPKRASSTAAAHRAEEALAEEAAKAHLAEPLPAVEEPAPCADLLAPPARPARNPGFMQRWIFGFDLNRQFASGADASFRAGMVVALCAVCWWIPPLQWLTEQGWSLQYAITVFAFTFTMDVGQTMMSAWYTIIGTIVAVVNCLFMFAVFNEGVVDTEDSYAKWFAFLNFMIMTIFYAVLNLPMLLRMFAMYLQAYFTMSFLNPESKVHFAYTLRDMTLKDGLLGPLLGTIMGTLLSVLASLCPHPLSAFTNAQDMAVEISWKIGRQWENAVTYYAGAMETFEVHGLWGEAVRLYEQTDQLEAVIKTSWWECFDLGSHGRVRARLVRLFHSFQLLQDWLHAVSAAAKQEALGGAARSSLPAELVRELQAVASHASSVMNRTTQLAVSIRALPEDRARLEAAAAALGAARQSLLDAFAKAQSAEGGHASEALGAHLFVCALSSFGECAGDLAEFVLETTACTEDGSSSLHSAEGSGEALQFWQRHSGGESLQEGLRGGLRAWVDRSVLGTWEHMRQSARIVLAFTGAFMIGRFGIPDIMSNYTSTPAGTTAFLLAFDVLGGSAFKYKFVRLQGLAVGTVLGQLVYAMLIRCNFWGIISGFFAVFSFEFFAFYYYFTSEHFPYTGLLIATFGAEQMLSGCGGLEDSHWEVYQALLGHVVAIFCVLASDFLVGPPSPAKLAVQAYGEASSFSRQSLAELLQPEGHTASAPLRAELFARLRRAEVQGTDAGLEPRFIRTEWREELWGTLVRQSFRMAEKLAVMEHIAGRRRPPAAGACRTRGPREVPRRSPLARLVRSKALREAAEHFLQRRDEILSLAQKLMLHDQDSPIGEEHEADVRRLVEMRQVSLKLDVKKIMQEVAGEKTTEPAEAEVGACLLLLELSARDLDAVAHSLIKAPELSLHAMAHAGLKPPKAGLIREISTLVEQVIQYSQESIWGARGSAGCCRRTALTA